MNAVAALALGWRSERKVYKLVHGFSQLVEFRPCRSMFYYIKQEICIYSSFYNLANSSIIATKVSFSLIIFYSSANITLCGAQNIGKMPIHDVDVRLKQIITSVCDEFGSKLIELECHQQYFLKIRYTRSPVHRN